MRCFNQTCRNDPEITMLIETDGSMKPAYVCSECLHQFARGGDAFKQVARTVLDSSALRNLGQQVPLALRQVAEFLAGQGDISEQDLRALYNEIEERELI